MYSRYDVQQLWQVEFFRYLVDHKAGHPIILLGSENQKYQNEPLVEQYQELQIIQDVLQAVR